MAVKNYTPEGGRAKNADEADSKNSLISNLSSLISNNKVCSTSVTTPALRATPPQVGALGQSSNTAVSPNDSSSTDSLSQNNPLCPTPSSLSPKNTGLPRSLSTARNDGYISKYGLLLDLSSICFSLIGDFYIKTTGRSNLYESDLMNLPYISDNRLRLRVLLLSCLTKYYAELWEGSFIPEFTQDSWAKDDPRLPKDTFSTLSNKWDWHTPLRTDFARRQALIEIDVLTAMAIGMTLDELLTIYRIQFSVLQSYEKDTWYDANGKIVFSAKNMGNLIYKNKDFKKIKDAKAGEVFTRTITDDTKPGGPFQRKIEYVAPFDCCDREKDYETAWKFFEEKYQEK